MPNFIIKPAIRTDNVTYAVRDIVVLANEVAKTGKEMLYLNIGDPNLFDWEPPKHLVEETYKAMLNNKNGYAPSSGIKIAVEAIGNKKCTGYFHYYRRQRSYRYLSDCASK